MPKGNQFSAGPPRPPLKRKDEVTKELIFLCLFYVGLAGVAMIGFIDWMG